MKEFLFVALFSLGITRLARLYNRNRVTILCYHGVTERTTRSSLDPFGLHVRRDRFLAQLDYLQRNYQVISLREYLEAIHQGRRLSQYSVILTFDDGYRNFLTAAASRLSERGMPVTIFLITDLVRQDPHAFQRTRTWMSSDDETYLSWAEVQELEQDPNYEFGSHTCSHSKLPLLSLEEMDRQLRESYAVIALHVGKANGLPLAYPKGQYTGWIAQRAHALGYGCALTTDAGCNDLNSDLFALRRVLIGDDDSVPAFSARVSGLTSWLKGIFRNPFTA